jgi:hypothetical protein
MSLFKMKISILNPSAVYTSLLYMLALQCSTKLDFLASVKYVEDRLE